MKNQIINRADETLRRKTSAISVESLQGKLAKTNKVVGLDDHQTPVVSISESKQGWVR
jgi:hypothetical protein